MIPVLLAYYVAWSVHGDKIRSMQARNMGETCFVCSSLIREASTEHEGEPALLCEGRHKRWAHARCVGVSDAFYADIQTCETPWLCTECYNEAAKAVQNLPLLQEEIESLKAENTGVKKEIGELKALVASLHAALTAVENMLKSVSSHIDLLQSVPAEEVSAETPSQLEPTSPEQAPRSSYSDVTCSIPQVSLISPTLISICVISPTH